MQEYISSVRILLKVANGRSLDNAIGAHDSPLSRQIAYGVLRNFYSLSAALEHLLTKPLADKHQDIELLLLAGIYSINSLNRPAHASVNFTVDAAAGLKKPWAKKLINGVLRNYQRKAEAIAKSILDDREAITNHPEWLIDRIESAYPKEHEAIFAANQVEPPMTLRVNLAKTSREDYLALLQENDDEAHPGDLAATSVYLKAPRPVDRLPGFPIGLVSIQDEASQLIPMLLNLEPGQRLLDACAAPGGKTCAILEQHPSSIVTAIDKEAKRASIIFDNLQRLDLKCNVIAEDLLDHMPSETYDRILLDVPCSATGILRRHPDIKLLRLDSDIDKLVATQEDLLAKAWSLLSPNGELLYSTCSILPTENADVIQRFLEANNNASLLPVEALLPGIAQSVKVYPQGLQLLPTTNGTDGFFFSRLKKSHA